MAESKAMSGTQSYFTWEEDFTSDRAELHGFSGELVAVIDTTEDNQWTVHDATGKLIATCHKQHEAKKHAEKLLGI